MPLKIARLSMFILSVQRQLLSGMFRQPRMCQLYLVIPLRMGAIGTVFAKDIVVMANARVNLDSVRTTGWVDIRDDNSSVSRGNIAGNLQLSSAAKILNSYIGGDVISTSMPRLTNCDLQKSFTGGGSLQNTRVVGDVTTVDALRLVLIDVSLATLMVTGKGFCWMCKGQF